MNKLPPMPKLPRAGSGSRTGKRKAHRHKVSDLDREVKWKQGVEESRQPEHVYGTCAKCGMRKQALDLTWRPDRLVFGELHLGFWACRDGCEE